MGMVVQHNMTAMNANRNLGVTAGNLAKSTEKLSSGYKINRAGDNAAGLAISEKMRGQIRGLDQASTNAEDGISMIQTAEGALTETHSILQRMRELAVQASSDTNTDDDRTQIQNEIDQLTEEVDRIANTTEFNTKKLLDGSRKGAVSSKEGNATVEGNFSNSNVSASISSDTVGKTAFTDAIRLEVTQDYKTKAGTSSVDGYVSLVEKNADIDKAVNDLISTTNNTMTAAECDAYVQATVAALKAGTTAEGTGAGLSSAQTTAWSTIENKAGALSTSESVTGEISLSASATKAQVSSALKDALDKKAKNLVELETKEANTTISATNVTKTSDGSTSDAKSIIEAASSAKVTYEKTKTEANKAGLADVGTHADAYKKAFEDALNSGMSADDAKNADDVIKAREALYDAMQTDLKDTATAITADATLDGQPLTNAANKKSDAAAAAFDEYVRNAETLAVANVDKANAIAELKSKTGEGGTFAEGVNYSVQDLFGNSENMKVSSTLDAENNLKITLNNGSDKATTITIANADKLKAGDTLTITAQSRVETEPAATGKDAFRLQVGANAGQEVSLGINSMKSKDLNIVQTKPGVEGKALDVTNQKSASLAIEAYDMAIQSVSTERAKMGAMQNRLEHTISNLDTSSENLQSAESSLRDTDMAEEMTKYSKNNILMQAGQSMLAQANQSTQGVLSLLG